MGEERPGITIPHEVEGFSFRAFRVDVLTGPEAGRRIDVANDVLTVGSADGNDLVLSDPTVSRYHLEIRRRGDRIVVVDNGSTNGTEVAGVLLREATIRPGTVLKVGRVKIRVDDAATVTVDALSSDRFGHVRGRSPVMRRLLARAIQCANSDVSVLLQGETGTGKEVIAQTIHEASKRADGPFEIVDCGTLLPTLIASELFGHERGAFTGAEETRLGAFERANGGTILLDEIGELPMPLQAALLGVLERRTFRRVGGDRPISVDVRVLAATHRDLRAHVNAGSFRSDLYYRIGVVRLEVPPLRDRIEDLPLLMEHFLEEAGYDESIDSLIPPETMQMLESHHWPGNVRELRNFVDSALALGEPPELDVDPSARSESPVSVPGNLLDKRYHEARELVLSEFEKRYLERLLERAGNNVSKAARIGGINRSYLRQLLARHKLGR